MNAARSGAGDPARTLALLWRGREAPDGGPPRRGPRQGLTVDGVVSAAVGLADAEGLQAVTMRHLAQTLGVSPMTLYTYVPGKAELLDLMLDLVYQRMAHTPLEGRSTRARLEAVAEDNRALLAAHGWVATVSTSRPPLGPGLLAKYEHELQALEGTALDDVERDASLTLLLDFVRTAALSAAEARAARRESDLDDAQWWEASAPLLARALDPATYPTAARVGTAAGAAQGGAYNPERAYQFGLQRVLDGLDVWIKRRSNQSNWSNRPGAGGAGAGPGAGQAEAPE